MTMPEKRGFSRAEGATYGHAARESLRYQNGGASICPGFALCLFSFLNKLFMLP